MYSNFEKRSSHPNLIGDRSDWLLAMFWLAALMFSTMRLLRTHGIATMKTMGTPRSDICWQRKIGYCSFEFWVFWLQNIYRCKNGDYQAHGICHANSVDFNRLDLFEQGTFIFSPPRRTRPAHPKKYTTESRIRTNSSLRPMDPLYLIVFKPLKTASPQSRHSKAIKGIQNT